MYAEKKEFKKIKSRDRALALSKSILHLSLPLSEAEGRRRDGQT